MFPSIRNLLGRRGSSATLLPSNLSSSHIRIVSFGAFVSTSLFLFFVANPHSPSSILTAAWHAIPYEGLAAVPLEDLVVGYTLFPAERSYGSDGASLTKEVQILDDGCLERWIGRGESCEKESMKPVVVDIVWTWVNGTDPEWFSQFSHHVSSANVPEVPFKHFRNKSELQHSVRAALQAMRGRIRTFHLVLGDWALSDDDREEVLDKLDVEDEGQDWRVGQVPTWLRKEVIGVANEESVEVRLHHHSDIFRDRTASGAEWEERQFREDVLPTFNSFAIESNLVNIPGLADNFIYLNDEFLLTRPHSITDWVHPLFGPVLRIAQPAWIEPAEEYPATSCPHELSALIRSNFLMGHRFGAKKRPGVEHIGKLLSTPLLEEIAIMWRTDFTQSAHRRFREVDRGLTDSSRVGDLHASWLGPLFLVERARESMLWTWAIARMGGLDGMWGEEEREELREMLGLSEGEGEEKREERVEIPKFVQGETRPMMEWENLVGQMEEMEVEGPQVTELLWSSLDGPLPTMQGYKSLSCIIDMDRCFGAFWTESATTTAVNAFKRLAFEYPSCGDCILSSLIRASGHRGLSALLPPTSSAPFAPSHSSTINQPHMPLEKVWRGIDFSLENVVRSPAREAVDLRAWCLRLIARYQFVAGRSEFAFTMIKHPADMKEAAAKLSSSAISSMVLNDDIEGLDTALSIASMVSWLDAKWPIPAAWERPKARTD